MNLRRVVLGLGTALVLSGIVAYQFWPSGIAQPDSDKTREAVLARIPPGTEIPRVSTIMEAEGFKCARLYSGFSDDIPGHRGQVSHPPANNLWCDRERMVGPLISRRWQVIFVDDGGLVAGVAVAVGLTGP